MKNGYRRYHFLSAVLPFPLDSVAKGGLGANGGDQKGRLASLAYSLLLFSFWPGRPRRPTPAIYFSIERHFKMNQKIIKNYFLLFSNHKKFSQNLLKSFFLWFCSLHIKIYGIMGTNIIRACL
jgi:hypothetical protein